MSIVRSFVPGISSSGSSGSGGSGVTLAADSTGATDISAALVTQATAAKTAGQPLLVPPGDYLLTATAALPDGATVWAPSGARFFGALNPGPLLTIGGAGTALRGMEVENTASPDGRCISLRTSAANTVIEDCTIISAAIGIYIDASGIENVKIRGCRFEDAYWGILTNPGANDIVGVNVEGCHFVGIGGDAIEFNHPSGSAPTCRGFRVAHNHIQCDTSTGGTTSTGFGVGVAGVADITIVGNTIYGARREGIHIEDGCRNVVIADNVIDSVPNTSTNYGGIVVYPVDTEDLVITGNVVANIAGDHNGIELVYTGQSDTHSNVTITGNTIRNIGQHGIYAGAQGVTGGHYLISNNIIRGCADYGIAFVGNFSHATAQGNLIADCGGYGIGGGEFGTTRMFRNNVITDCALGDYDFYGNSNYLNDRYKTIAPTAASTGSTMTVPLFRIGKQAEGTLAVGLLGQGTGNYIESTWRLRWDSTNLYAERIGHQGATYNDTNLVIVGGVLSVVMSVGGAGVILLGAASFNGMMTEQSNSTADATGRAFPGAVVDIGQAAYDALTPVSGVLYVVTGA